MTLSPAGLWKTFTENSGAERSRDAIAIVYGEQRLTHGELIERSLALAASWLKRARTERNMRVLILLTDPLDILLSILAAWSLDSTAAVLRSYGSEAVPRLYLDTLTPDLIVTPDHVVAGERPSRGSRDAKECLILATSGTITEPKLVAIPAHCPDLSTSTIARNLDLTAQDRVQVASPLTYFYGLIGGALMALRQGATIFLYAPPFVPSVLQADLRKFDITVVQGTPSFHRIGFEYWNGSPFESVRVVTFGGELLGATLASRLATAYPLAKHVQVFGMTEGGRISHNVMSRTRYSDTIGVPFPYIEWKIVPLDSERDGGRLAIRGPTVMPGYVHPSRGYWGLEEDGFFVTNDLVAQGPDGLRYLGRYDRCFKSGGKLVNPAVIESLLKSQDQVKNALCVPRPHNLLGQVPITQVVLEKGAEVSVERLRAFCATELEPHMVPSEIVIVPDLPRGAGGKTLLREA